MNIILGSKKSAHLLSGVSQPHDPGHVMHIALVSNSDYSFYQFRLGFIRLLIAQGWKVTLVAPAGKSVSALEREGATFVDWRLHRGSMNPWREFRSLLSLFRIYRSMGPVLVHHYTAKPLVYGALAARLAGVPVVIGSLTGLGYVFSGMGWKTRFLGPLLRILYGVAFRWTDRVMTLNPDDQRFVADLLHGRTEKALVVGGGEGVDTTWFDPAAVDAEAVAAVKKSLDIGADVPVVTCIARLLKTKGVHEFMDAASLSNERGTSARWVLVGGTDYDNPAAVREEQVAMWRAKSEIHFFGETSQIREVLAASDVVVLPSYREGLPQVLLEAAAMAKPIVTTDVPGCRDAIENGITGLLVPPKDHRALADAVERLLADKAQLRQLGIAGRERVVREFQAATVAHRIIRIYTELLTTRGVAKT